MSRIIFLGDLQYAIMHVLWALGEGTVKTVHGALLEERGLAPTTIATMLKKMEGKGVVAHRIEGRRYVYHPTVAEREVRRSMVGELIERAFRGDAAALVNHLLEEEAIDPGELSRLKALIEAKAREETEGPHA